MEGESPRKLWEVVGGGEKGGVVVRMEKDIHSTELSQLSKGAVVEELELAGNRLHYRKVEGSGPNYGWVSVMFKNTRLLVERKPSNPEAAVEEEVKSDEAAAESREEPTEEEKAQEEFKKEAAFWMDVGRLFHLLNPIWPVEILEGISGNFKSQGVHGAAELMTYVFGNHLGFRLQQRGLEGLREQCILFREVVFRLQFTECTQPPPLHFSPKLQVLYVLRMFEPEWKTEMLFVMQGRLEAKLGVVGLKELLLLAGSPELAAQLETAAAAPAKEALLKFHEEVAAMGLEKWLGLDHPVRHVENVSGCWGMKRLGQEEDVFCFQFNQTPGSTSFHGPGISTGSIKGDVVDWKVHFHGCGGCIGLLDGEQLVHVLLLTEHGTVIEEYTAHREPGSKERLTVVPLADDDTAAAMKEGPNLPAISVPPAGHAVAVRTVPHLGEKTKVMPAMLLSRRPDKRTHPVCTLTLEPSVRYQTHLGFGGSFTESSADLLHQLDSLCQDRILDAYFNREVGLGYNMGRMHTTSCDFSKGLWSCCDKEDDMELESFSTERYNTAMLPMIRRAAAAAGGLPIKVIASPWSPPAWMKEPKNMLDGCKLRPDCAAVWARYFVRFIEEMEAAGLSVWAVTVQNEPGGKMRWESCAYSAEEERDFVRDHLGPLLASSKPDVKLIVWDHNRDAMFHRAQVIYGDPDAAKHVWGLGFHWYGDPEYETWPPLPQVCFDNVARVHELRPEKHLIMTEGCQENGPHFGEWRIAERYAMNIIEDLNRWTEAWIDWNLILDMSGGPNHAHNYCSAPVIADAQNDEVYFLPSYYYIAHFSRYILPGAVRILCASDRDVLRSTAFENPDGGFVVVVLNQGDVWVELSIQLGVRAVRTASPAHSITTFLINPEEADVEEAPGDESPVRGGAEKEVGMGDVKAEDAASPEPLPEGGEAEEAQPAAEEGTEPGETVGEGA